MAVRKIALALVVLVSALPVWAESSVGTNRATASLTISITVPPVLRILERTPTPEGYALRIWTNMREVMLDGQTFRLNTVGEHTVQVRPTNGIADGLSVVAYP